MVTDLLFSEALVVVVGQLSSSVDGLRTAHTAQRRPEYAVGFATSIDTLTGHDVLAVRHS